MPALVDVAIGWLDDHWHGDVFISVTCSSRRAADARGRVSLWEFMVDATALEAQLAL